MGVSVVQVKQGVMLCLFVIFLPLYVQACEQEMISIVLLAPQEEEQAPFAQSLLDGLVAGDLEPIDEPCKTTLHHLDTSDESQSFYSQWLQALELEPDFLIGPLLQEHQQQLHEVPQIDLPQDMVWLYPGDRSLLAVNNQQQLFGFSINWYGQLSALLEYGWDQGQYDLALLLSDSELGHQIAGRAELEWVSKGGEVTAVTYYGKAFSDLNRAMRRLLRQSDGRFDFILLLAGDQRLRMVSPLMKYHEREEMVYSLTPPVGELGLGRDLDGLLYPMQPVLLERSDKVFEADDFLLQVENIGLDLKVLLRRGLWPSLVENKGLYFGYSGRYRVEEQELIRTPCFVRNRKGEQTIEFCPEQSETEIE